MAETGHGTVGGPTAQIGGEEAKTHEILRSTIEVPSKYHRRSFVTSRSHHAYHTPAARSQQAGRAGAGQWGLGELAELKRLPNQAGAEGLLSDQDTLDVE